MAKPARGPGDGGLRLVKVWFKVTYFKSPDSNPTPEVEREGFVRVRPSRLTPAGVETVAKAKWLAQMIEVNPGYNIQILDFKVINTNIK